LLPCRKNPKPGNPVFSEHSTNTSPTLTSWPPDFAASTASVYPVGTGLARINRELIGKAEALDSPQRVVLEMDSTEIPVYGQQDERDGLQPGSVLFLTHWVLAS